MNPSRLVWNRFLKRAVCHSMLLAALGQSRAVVFGSSFEASVLISPGCAAVDGAQRCKSSSSTDSAVSVGAGPFVEQQGFIFVGQDALAIAGPGSLKAVANSAARTNLEFGAFSPSIVFDNAHAAFTLDDIVLSGPAGETIPVSFNIVASGGLTNEFDPTMYASASVTVRYGISTSFGGVGNVEFGAATRTNGTLTASGAFASGDLSVSGSTAPQMARAGDTISFSLLLDVGAGSGCNAFGCPFDSDAYGSAAFADTISFPLTGPVANLPPGWTINSASGMIVNNQFVGVPEPGVLALLTFATAMAAFPRRHTPLHTRGSARSIHASCRYPLVP